jgi:hypothetical protein
MKGETESKMTAAQDQALQTKCLATQILQKETDSKWRPCQQFYKTTDHIALACPLVAKTNTYRDNKARAQLHFKICKKIQSTLDNENWYAFQGVKW